MKGLVNKKVERYLDLVLAFEVHDGFLDREVGATILGSHANSLSVDIAQANDLFAPIFTIKSDDNLQILYKDANSYMDAFCFAMRLDPICSLLEKAFFQSHLDVGSMAAELYVSPSTVYRWVDQFNTAVADFYDVHLETHPLVMKGDEAEVRSFYMTFFKEKYTLYEWPFPNISKQQLSLFLDRALPLRYAKNFLQYYECFHIQLAVSMRRFSQGFRLADADLATNARCLATAQEVVAQGHLAPLLSLLSEEPHANADSGIDAVRFCQELLSPFVGDHDAESFDVLLSLTAHDPLANRLFIYISKLIAYLCDTFPVRLENESDVILALYNALMGTFGKTISRCLLYSPYRIYQESMRVKFPAVCNRILDIIRTQNQLFSLSQDPDFVSYLFYVIWSTWENLSNQLIKKPRKLKVLVLSKFSIFHASSLRSEILFYFGNLVDVHLSNDSPFFLESIDFADYDLLVSNFKVTDAPIPTFLCNGIDSYATYAAMADAIFSVL